MPDKPFIPGNDQVAPAITGGHETPADQTARQVDRERLGNPKLEIEN